jgi:hypothetical protein
VIAGVADRHVIVLEIVVDRDLPVALPGVDPGLVDGFHLFEAIGTGHLGEIAEHLGDAGAAADDANEHETQQDLELHRLQAQLFLLDAGMSRSDGTPARRRRDRRTSRDRGR